MTRKPNRPKRSLRTCASQLLYLATLCTGLGGCAPEKSNVIHQERSLYRNIYVTQDDDLRCMTFRMRASAVAQGCIRNRDPAAHAMEYSKLEMAGLYAMPAPHKVMVVGLGVGAIPRTIQELFPRTKLDVVEIDPAVVKIARTHFAYQPAANTRMIIDDGRRFVRKQGRLGYTYDLIFLDAFNGEYIPEHLVTAEFLIEVKQILAPNGVVAANTWSTSKLFDSESATYNLSSGVS